MDLTNLQPFLLALLQAGDTVGVLQAVAQGAYDLGTIAQEEGVEGMETYLEHAGALLEAVGTLAMPEDNADDTEDPPPAEEAAKGLGDWWAPTAPTIPRRAPAHLKREAPHKVTVRRITVLTRSIEEDVQGPVEGETLKRRLVVASTASVDRYGDIVDQKSLKLDNYKANPILLWQHNAWEVVGRAAERSVEVRDVDGKAALVFAPEWDTDETNPTGRRVASQWTRGFLRCVSIGFAVDWDRARRRCDLPKDHPAFGERGMYFEGAEIVEISAVSIPANTEAKDRPDLA